MEVGEGLLFLSRAMVSLERCRQLLGATSMSNEEITTFLGELDVLIDTILDDMFYEELETDDV